MFKCSSIVLIVHLKRFKIFSVNLRFIIYFQVLEQQAGSSDDFQEIGSEEKGVVKRKHSMDSVLEDKICDLYDLYVDVLILHCPFLKTFPLHWRILSLTASYSVFFCLTVIGTG